MKIAAGTKVPMPLTIIVAASFEHARLLQPKGSVDEVADVRVSRNLAINVYNNKHISQTFALMMHSVDNPFCQPAPIMDGKHIHSL